MRQLCFVRLALRACLPPLCVPAFVFKAELRSLFLHSYTTTNDVLCFPADGNYFGYHNYHEGSSAAAAAAASGGDSSAAAAAASSGDFTPFCTIS